MPYKPGGRLTPENNPGGARWCTDHQNPKTPDKPFGRLECNKHAKRSGKLCHNPAIRGTDACRLHGGKKREVLKAQGQARISAWSVIGNMSKAVDYRMAVLGVLQMTWLRLGAYSELLRQQVVVDGDTAEGTELDEPNSSGLIGHRYGMGGKDGITYVQTEEIRALVQLEAAERDRVVKYAKTAHDMGISDRLTSLAERWGDLVATRITAMLDELDLSPEQQRKVPILVQSHLGSIDVTEMGGDGK